jgi:hypothetical protein
MFYLGDGGVGGIFPDELPIPMPLAGRRGKRSMMLPSNSGFGNTKSAFKVSYRGFLY